MTALDQLIGPHSREAFFQDYWEQKPLVVQRGQPDYFASLLSLDEIDRVLTTADRRYPDIVLKNARGAVDEEDYTLEGDRLDVARVYQLFAEGATITLAYLDNVVPSLSRLCRGLEADFSCPFQANVYLTPAAAQGAKWHYDTHDVFVAQVAGSKHWTLYGTPVELPLPQQDFDPAVHPRGEPLLEFDLHAGDAAYIPRGVVHDARSREEVSLHITVGVLRYTWADLLLECVAEAALADPAFRRALPPGFARPGFDRKPMHATFQALLSQLAAKADFDPLVDRFSDETATAQPMFRGQLAQILQLPHLTLRSRAARRPGATFRLPSGSTAAIEAYGRSITFPPQAGEALRFALRTPEFAIGELPGGLDEASKLTIVRRLIREGLLVAVQP